MKLIAENTFPRSISVATVAAAAILFILWSGPGLDMYPLDDGWVSFSSNNLDFQWRDLFFGNSRELRYVPYLIARALEDNGFTVINSILIALDLAVFAGLFAVFYLLLEKRSVPAFVAAGLVMLFPGDPTMFWLGAFGVNISFALLTWATYCNLRAIDRKSVGYQACALLLLYCGIRTYSGYVFLPLIFIPYYVFARCGRDGLLRGLVRYSLPQLVIFSIALAPTLLGLAAGSGREGHVASLELSSAMAGYKTMFANLGYGWLLRLGATEGISIPSAVGALAVFTGAVLALGSAQPDKPAGATGHRSPAMLVITGFAVIMLCYLPFSVSDVRFNAGRALMGSRVGFFLILVVVGDWIYRKLPRSRYVSSVFSAIAIGTLTVFALGSLSLFQARHRQSLFQRVFLADLAAVVPCPPKRPIVIVAGPREFGRRTGGSMLVNRPRFPIRTMYANSRVNAYVVSNFMLSRNGRLDPSDGTVVYKGVDLGSEPLLLRYSFASGFRHVMRVSVRVGHERQRATIRGTKLPAKACSATPLMHSLLDDRDTYLKALDLHR